MLTIPDFPWWKEPQPWGILQIAQLAILNEGKALLAPTLAQAVLDIGHQSSLALFPGLGS